MSEFDIFKLIRSTPERRKSSSDRRTYSEGTESRPEIDDFIRGSEERKYKNRQRKVETKDAELEQEITERKKEKKYKNAIRKINLVELDKLPVKNQNKILIREYIEVYEKLESYERELEKLDDTVSNNSITLHQIQKETVRLKDLVRNSVTLMPNGSEVKRLIETNVWNIDEVEDLLLGKIDEVVERAKNLDVHIENATKQLSAENKTLQKKFVQQQTEITKRDQYIEELKTYYENQMQAMTKQHQQSLSKVKKQHEIEINKLHAEIEKVKNTQTIHQPTTPTPPTNIPKPTFDPDFSKQTVDNVKENNFIENPAVEKPIQHKPVVEKIEEKAKEEVIDDIDIPSFDEPEVPEIDDLPDIPAFGVPDEEDTTEEIDIQPEIPSFEDTVPEIPSFDFEPETSVPSMDIPEPPSFDIPEPPSFESDTEEVEEDDDDELVMFDPEPYLERLSDTNKTVIKVIGKTGVSRNKELREALEEDEETRDLFMKGNKFNTQEMSSTIKGLKDAGILNAETVKLGAKGGYNFNVYELSDLGKGIYKSLSGKKAVVSEKKLIMDQHASLEHGYLIKESATEFEEMGYKVYTDRKDLRFDLPNGKRKDFDLIIEKDGKKSMIEVERGTHNEEDFFNAMDKIFQITNEFYFICPNEQILFGKTKIAFFRWIKERLGGIQNAKGKLTANFTTLEKVKKRGKTIWEPVDFK